MTAGADPEAAAIDRLRAVLGARRASPRGIGDDAALLDAADGRLIAVDTLVEGVHFDLAWSSPADVAFKALATNVSDIWAMGGEPTAWLLSLGMPAATARAGNAFIDALCDGFRQAQRDLAVDMDLVGGDTVRSPALTLSLTLVGRSDGPVLTRSGARPGDGLWIDGTPGLAELGLEALRRGRGEDPRFAVAVAAHRRPRPRRIGAAAAVATAAMDVSDGLAVDVGRLAAASGVGATLHLPLPGRADLEAGAHALGLDPDMLGLRGGDDYLRLVTAPVALPPPFVRVGTVVAAADGLTLEGADGTRQPFAPSGFSHFGAHT